MQSEPHLADFKDAAIPVKSVVHAWSHSEYYEERVESSRTDSLLGILRSFENHCATAFRSTIRPNIDVSANNVARGSEQIFQVLPPGLIWQLEGAKSWSDIGQGGTLTFPT